MKTTKISPSILSADFAQFGTAVRELEDAGADMVHIDIMDGHFVNNLTFGAGVVAAIRPHSQLFYDCHLMVEHPEKYIQPLAAAGADSLTVHAEASQSLAELISEIKAAGLKAAVAIKPDTPVSAVLSVLNVIDMVLVMTVNPGFGGQKFMEECLDKVAVLAQLREDKLLGFDIQVDGGIDDKTISKAKKAGANVFVAGSFVYKGTVAQQIQKLKEKL